MACGIDGIDFQDTRVRDATMTTDIVMKKEVKESKEGAGAVENTVKMRARTSYRGPILSNVQYTRPIPGARLSRAELLSGVSGLRPATSINRGNSRTA